jgi:type IV secretory pathway VirD2 relaxase
MKQNLYADYKERLAANLEGHEWAHNLDGDETFYFTNQSNDDKEWKKVVERAENAQRNLRQVLSTISDEKVEKELHRYSVIATL